MSLHEWPFYPGSGGPDEQGETLVNIPIAAGTGDGSVTLPTTLLVDTGTSGGAELFASALVGNNRAELIGEHTLGRAALQKLVRLPDGSGLWLTTTRFLTPSGGHSSNRRARIRKSYSA